jgi:RNA polymerase sigma factor (sigma-70 family)
VPDPTTTIERAVSSWMYRIVHNHFVKHYRKARVRAHLNVRMDTEIAAYSAGHGALAKPARDADSDRGQTQTTFWPAQRTHAVRVAGQYAHENPDGRKTLDGLGDEIEAALGDLPPQHREILERVMLRDGKYHEVARELGIPIGTVMSSINRARNRMIARLGAWAASEYGITDQREARP